MAEKTYISPRGLRSTKTRLLRGAFGIFAFTVTVGASLYRELFSEPVFYAVLAATLVWGAILMGIVKPERFKWHRLPAPVVLFLLMTLVSVLWAPNKLERLTLLAGLLILTAIAVAVAYLLTWAETLRTLAQAMRYLIGVGLAVVLWQKYVAATEPTVTLGLLSVIAATVFMVQWAAGLVRPFNGGIWTFIALVAAFLDGSFLTLSAFAVVAITLIFLVWARRSRPERRMPMYFVGMLALAATIIAAISFNVEKVLAEKILADSSSTLNVTVENIWVQILTDEGVLGFALFLLLVFVTTWRVWFRAVDQPRRGAGTPLPYAKSALWPALVTMSLLVFSIFTASTILVPGWFLLVLFAIKTRFDYILPTKNEDLKRLAWRDVPIAGANAK